MEESFKDFCVIYAFYFETGDIAMDYQEINLNEVVAPYQVVINKIDSPDWRIMKCGRSKSSCVKLDFKKRTCTIIISYDDGHPQSPTLNRHVEKCKELLK